LFELAGEARFSGFGWRFKEGTDVISKLAI